MEAANSLAILALITLLASGAMLAWAMRGRRVDDHPMCRRCGFDLYGRPSDAQRCSECGADLGRRRAVRVGRRERRRGVVAVTAPGLLLSLGWLAFVGWTAAARVAGTRHKPAWWLTRLAESKDPAPRDAALGELTRRIPEGTLGTEREQALIAKALDHQGRWDQPWVAGW